MQPCRGAERFVFVITQAPFTRASLEHKPLFEAWLQSDLQRLYDKTLHEPVPDDLLQLLARAPEPFSTRS